MKKKQIAKTTVSNMEPIGICDGGKLTEEEWLAWRLPASQRKQILPSEYDKYSDPMSSEYIPYTIGGSAVASVMGVSPWITATELYDKMTGNDPKYAVEINAESKIAGHIFEPFVALNFMRYMKKYLPDVKFTLIKDIFRDIRPYLKDFIGEKPSKAIDTLLDDIFNIMVKKWGINPNVMFQCGDTDSKGNLLYPWALANLDGIIEITQKNGKKGRGIWEAKTTSSRNIETINNWKAGIVPAYYMTQIQYYMKIMNLDFTYITCCWGFTLDDMVVIKVDKDPDYIETMFNELTKFVDMIDMGCSPDPAQEDQELLAQYYVRKFGAPEPSVPMVDLPDSCEETVIRAQILADEIAAAENRLKDLKRKSAEVYNQLLPIYGKAEYGQLRINNSQVIGIKLVTPMKRPGFDEAAFKTKYPDLYKECLDDPQLNLTLLGKRHAKEKREFVIPAEVNPNSSTGPSYKLTVMDRPVLP
ncbi:MAG: YqaJ viral recombinase family protein [Lachnospiraceae bacterium]|nr:YqaJ viral recombinase family protein [Lachnospiraceae bacterium]